MIIASGSGRNRFEFGSIEPPYKRQAPFSGNPFLPVREKAIDSGRRRALRARGGGSKIQKPKTFWREDFLEGNANTNPSVLAPPSRARTSPFAGGYETSEAPYTLNAQTLKKGHRKKPKVNRAEKMKSALMPINHPSPSALSFCLEVISSLYFCSL